MPIISVGPGAVKWTLARPTGLLDTSRGPCYDATALDNDDVSLSMVGSGAAVRAGHA